MESAMILLTLVLVTTIVIRFPVPSIAISCGGSCSTLDDCDGQLICINEMCFDDPDIGTQICKFTPSVVPSSISQTCHSLGTMHCAEKSYSRYDCSPPVTSSTRAALTNNDFDEGGDGGAPSECDGRFHSNSDLVVALSTGWYSNGFRCGRKIKITSAKTGRTVLATVVDECDSMNGCDDEHANQPPCPHNIVDGSDAVWTALGLDKDVGVEAITWSMA